MYVTGKALSTVLGVSERRIRQLVSEGILSKDENNKQFYLPSCVQKYIDYKVNAQMGDNEIDYQHEKSRHERAKRVRAEISLQAYVAKMHNSEDIEKVMTDMIVNAKNKLRGIPSKIAPSLSTQIDLPIIESILANEIDDCLLELASYTPELFTSSKKAGDPND